MSFLKKAISTTLLSLTLITISGFSNPTYASTPNSRLSIRWGVSDNDGTYHTDTRVQTYLPKTLYRYAALYSGRVRSYINTTREGFREWYEATPGSVSSLRSYMLSSKQGDNAYVGSVWNSYACLPGPTFIWEDKENENKVKITVKNTTDHELYVKRGKGYRVIESGKTIDHYNQDPHIRQVNFQIKEDDYSWNTCATLFWDLDRR